MHADLVLLGGVIYPMTSPKARAKALAVKGSRILAVGSDEEIKTFIGPHTLVIKLDGRAVTPGLVDGHCHLLGLGRSLEDIDARGAKSPEEVAQKVSEAAKGKREGEWLTGRGWDQNLWPEREFPTHHALSTAAPKNPVSLRRIDGHALWANSAALKAANITSGTNSPPGGTILLDQEQAPAGVLIDRAMELLEDAIPEEPIEATKRKILLAAKTVLAAGITGVHEMGLGPRAIEAYRALEREGKLPLRVYAFREGRLDGELQLQKLYQEEPEKDPTGEKRFVLRGVKLYADGALGSRGAALTCPYCDDPKNYGLWLLTKEELREAAKAGLETDWQVAVHAIGDAANKAVLDSIEFLGAVVRPKRFRIEHAQILDIEDIPRFGQLGVLAAVQPSHATSDMPWAEERLGKERLKGAYAWRSLLHTGAIVVGGSDFPIEEHPALWGLHAAVTRQDRRKMPPGGWFPEQRLTLEEALWLYTGAPAFASFQESQRGKIAPGLVADLTIFDRDLSAENLLETEISYTIVGGEIRYPCGQ